MRSSFDLRSFTSSAIAPFSSAIDCLSCCCSPSCCRRAPALCAKLLHVRLHLLLLVGELLRRLHRVVQVARRPAVLLLVEQTARLLQAVRAPAHASPDSGFPVRRRLPHRVRGVLKPARRVGETLRSAFRARDARAGAPAPPSAARGRADSARRTRPTAPEPDSGCRPSPRALVLLLLPRGELRAASRPSRRPDCRPAAAVDLLLTALHRLVLVAQLVLLQLEDVGEILGVGR